MEACALPSDILCSEKVCINIYGFFKHIKLGYKTVKHQNNVSEVWMCFTVDSTFVSMLTFQFCTKIYNT